MGIYLFTKRKKCQEEADVQAVEDQVVAVASSGVVEEAPALHAQQLRHQDLHLHRDQLLLSQRPNHLVWVLEAVVSWEPWQLVWLSEPVVKSLTRELEP